MLDRSLSVVIALGVLPLPVHAQVRVGPEFQVNAYTTGDQGASRVAVDAAGNFLVTWVAEQDGSGPGVFARWHEPSGVPVGASEFRVNAATAGSQSMPAVGSAPDGGMIVAWDSDGQDGSARGIYARRHPSAAAPPGPEFLVNGYTTGQQRGPSIAPDAAGGFVVVWYGAGPGDAEGVFGRRFDPSGSPRGGDFRVNTYITSAQRYPAVAADADGNFVVVWQSLGQDGSDFGVFAQRYDAEGAPVGGEFRVNVNTFGRQYRPAVTSAADGRFVVVWEGVQAGDSEVWGRRYDAAGVPTSDPFQVNVHTTGAQALPIVASDAVGAFVVAWNVEPQDGSGMGVFGRRYDAAGTPDPFEFPLHSHVTGNQALPAVALDGQGNFVATWSSRLQDGSAYGVFAQRFRPDLIFRDGFESGDLGGWSASSSDGGDLSVSGLAGLKFTSAGLRGLVDDTAGLYVQDDRPQDESQYRARFYFDPNGFDPGEAEAHRRIRIFLAFSEAPMRRVAAVVMRRLGGEYAIRGRARLDDGTQADTPFIPITDEPHVIEIELRRATVPFVAGGSFALSVDGAVESVVSLDNHLAEVDFARLGALSVKPGANGTMYWDEFEARRQGYIGP